MVAAFLVAASIGTALLALPVATEEGVSAGWSTASFTAVSAISVTGLVVVDTSSHWSAFGELTILALIQIGGFGITTMASLLGILMFRRMGLRSRMSTQVELSELDLGSMRSLLGKVALFFVVVETTGFVLLTVATLATTDASVGESAWIGLFHSISAFNNAGFSTYEDTLVGFATDPPVLAILALLVVVGSIGFPVVLDLVRHPTRWAWWSLHTRITVTATAVLLVGGALAIGAFEWTNPDTFGELPVRDRLTNAAFASVTPRTAGFNTFDYGDATQPTLLATIALMLVGGGSGSSAGGIKVTTFALLGFAIWSELRGDRDVTAFGRRIDDRTVRQAVTIALVGVGLAAGGSLLLAALGDLELASVAFETVSALSTVGLSTGITADLPLGGQLALTALMLLGRLGPVTVGTALMLRSRETLYRYPEGRPLLG